MWRPLGPKMLHYIDDDGGGCEDDDQDDDDEGSGCSQDEDGLQWLVKTSIHSTVVTMQLSY